MKLRWHLLLFAVLFATELALFPPAYRHLPPQVGDAIEVHNIAYNLARGRGYRLDWDDPVWRRLYADQNRSGRYTSILARHGSHATLSRPPLMPILVAACVRLVPGPDVFFAWRAVDAAGFAVAACLLCDAAVSLGGPGAAAAVVLVLFLDPLRWEFIPSWWTEGLTFDLLSVIAWLLVGGRVGTKPLKARVAAGVAVGLLCLTRSIFVPLLPVLCALLATALRSPGLRGRPRWFATARRAVLILAVACAVQLPWWARNVAVAGRFLPLGTQGGFNLPDEYGDVAVQVNGEWSGQGISLAWSPSAAGRAIPAGYTAAEFTALGPFPRWRSVVANFVGGTTASELAVSDAGTRAGVAWIRGHADAIPGLMAAKVALLFRGDLTLLAVAGIAAMTGLLRLGGDRPALARLVTVAAVYVLAVALTHVVQRRFLIPLLPFLYVAGAVGVASPFRPADPPAPDAA